MKYSAKGAPPQALLDWVALANEDWQPTYADLSGPPKDATYDALLAEQQGVCCYCGRGVKADGTDSHLDHFRPKSKYNAEHPPDLTIDYSNFALSCGPPSLPFARHLPRTCGSAKGEWFDEDEYVAPWDPACEGRFAYGVAGGVTAANPADAAAIRMIEVLALGHRALANERSTLLLDLENRIAAGEISTANVHEEIARWSEVKNGARISFGHIAARYLEDEIT